MVSEHEEDTYLVMADQNYILNSNTFTITYGEMLQDERDKIGRIEKEILSIEEEKKKEYIL
jgi:hypothetical protein